MSMIERMLSEEIRDKKRTGNGIHSKTGSRGYTGKILFPTDLMNSKQKRKYQRSGEVVTWNTKEVLPKLELEAYPLEQQKEMLTVWRENFTNKEIMQKMGLSNAQFYSLLNIVGVEKEKRSNRYTAKKNKTELSTAKVIELVEKKPTIQETTAPVFTEGLNFNINGKYEADVLSNWLTKLQMLVEGTGEYDVVIHLREKKAN